MSRKGLGASRIGCAHLVISAVFNEAVRNKKLADDFGADDCWNIDRIMRAPWTINYPDKTKRERGRVTVSTSLIEDASARTKFTIDQFVSVPLKSKNKKADAADSNKADAEEDSGEAYVDIGSPTVPTKVDLSELNGKLRRLIKNGLKDGESYGDGSRSGRRSVSYTS